MGCHQLTTYPFWPSMSVTYTCLSGAVQAMTSWPVTYPCPTLSEAHAAPICAGVAAMTCDSTEAFT